MRLGSLILDIPKTPGSRRCSEFTLFCPCVSQYTRPKCCLCVKGNVRLVSVSCGSQNVWAVDTRGVVYFRVGTQPLNPSMMVPAWIHIEPPVQVGHILDSHKTTCAGRSHSRSCDIMSLQPIGVQLVSIQTSPNDRLLWALDNRGSVFVRTGLSDEMPVGTDWELIPGTYLSDYLFRCDAD